jgi:hypothetical protein
VTSPDEAAMQCGFPFRRPSAGDETPMRCDVTHVAEPAAINDVTERRAAGIYEITCGVGEVREVVPSVN